MKGRNCNAQYGGLVLPSKWKSQSLIGEVIVSLQQLWAVRLDQPKPIKDEGNFIDLNSRGSQFFCNFFPPVFIQ